MKVLLHTERNPEDNAMLQALYSRSPESVENHVSRILASGSGKFMSQYYLGYGHGSIGDCGFVTLYFEGISMLAAKALEDSPLFNGQECSSRYIDFSEQRFHNPYHVNSSEYTLAMELFDDLRSFYTSSLDIVKNDLRQHFTKPEGENETRYEKSIAARAFDILRGFLPAGATTNVAWTTSLRKADEFLIHLMHHPLEEVKRMACEAYKQLFEIYPSSFREEYSEAAKVNVLDLGNMLRQIEGVNVFNAKSSVHNFYSFAASAQELEVYGNGSITCEVSKADNNLADWGLTETDKVPLPRHLNFSRSMVVVKDQIDFGSFRDIQRHRNGYCSNFPLYAEADFNYWYLNNLSAHPDSLIKARASKLLRKVVQLSRKLCHDNPLNAQYVVPMGYKVPVLLEYSVDQCRYVAKLRSGKTVHATLRPLAQKIGNFLNDELGLNVIFDKEEADWTLKRGDQDIVAKSEIENAIG